MQLSDNKGHSEEEQNMQHVKENCLSACALLTGSPHTIIELSVMTSVQAGDTPTCKRYLRRSANCNLRQVNTVWAVIGMLFIIWNVPSIKCFYKTFKINHYTKSGWIGKLLPKYAQVPPAKNVTGTSGTPDQELWKHLHSEAFKAHLSLALIPY